jgi:hypothetical protein
MFPATHSYETNGSYTVKVTAFSSTGETQSTSASLSIVNADDPLCNSQQYTLTLLKTGTGSGNIATNTGTINWSGNSGTATYDSNTSVTLTATASNGSTFTGWSGCDSTNSNQCTVTMNAAKSVTVMFTLNPTQYTLTVMKTGSGSGTISAGGLSCIGNTCSGTYNADTQVTMSATPDANSTFGGWVGCDSSSGNQCAVTMNAAKNVTATFTLNAQLETPKISVSPKSLNFGSSKVGSTSNPKTVIVKNTGKGNLILTTSTQGPNASEFSQTNDCSIISPGSLCTINVRFTPSFPFAKKSAVISISSNDPKKSNISVKLIGQVAPPKISVSPKSLNFGTVQVVNTSPSKIITIKNAGISDIIINNNINITGANASEFKQINDCSTVPKGSSCSTTVSFTPTTPAGTKTATISIYSNDPKKPTVNVKIKGKAEGTGVKLVSLSVTPVNPSISVGATQQFTATGTYSNSMTQDLTAQVTWSSSSISVATINSSGFATGVSEGSSTIKATLGSILGSTTLMVLKANPFKGNLQGSWSGVCGTTNVSGGFSVTIDTGGNVNGSYNGSDSGSIAGTVDIDGNFYASGVAGGFSWSGTFSLSNASLSGSGTWSGSVDSISCSGTWLSQAYSLYLQYLAELSNQWSTGSISEDQFVSQSKDILATIDSIPNGPQQFGAYLKSLVGGNSNQNIKSVFARQASDTQDDRNYIWNSETWKQFELWITTILTKISEALLPIEVANPEGVAAFMTYDFAMHIDQVCLMQYASNPACTDARNKLSRDPMGALYDAYQATNTPWPPPDMPGAPPVCQQQGSSTLKRTSVQCIVTPITFAPISPTCNYTCSAWGACKPNNNQICTNIVSSPEGCFGTPPAQLSQPCTYTPPTCTYIYSEWSACQPDNTQTRTVISSSPPGCVGIPILSQPCNYEQPPLTDAQQKSIAHILSNMLSAAISNLNFSCSPQSLLPPTNCPSGGNIYYTINTTCNELTGCCYTLPNPSCSNDTFFVGGQGSAFFNSCSEKSDEGEIVMISGTIYEQLTVNEDLACSSGVITLNIKMTLTGIPTMTANGRTLCQGDIFITTNATSSSATGKTNISVSGSICGQNIYQVFNY